MHDAHEFQEEVQALFAANTRTAGGCRYIVPSPELYPFQWLWDSCFHAIILARVDVAAAKAELRSALSSPLPSGMLPHILYHAKDGEYHAKNWGREMRGDVINASWGTDGTSSITQPPLMAEAIWRVYRAADHDVDFLAELYPVLDAHFRYLARERALAPYAPLLAIINPDESGEDNSPRFDRALGLPPIHTAAEHLEVRIKLIRAYAACGFSVARFMDEHFAIVDVPFNVIYAEGLARLGAIANVLGKPRDAKRWQKQARAVRSALREHCATAGIFRSVNARSGEHVLAATWARFMPLYGGLLSQVEADALVSELRDPERFGTKFPVPTTATDEAAYDPITGFWRGPVWMASNWFLYHGLLRYGFQDEAARIRAASIALLKQSGFREQYHPETGAGLGSHDFTWGGLVLDME